MAETFTPNRRSGDLDTAFVTNDALIANVLVFAAITLPVPSGTENSFTEQPVLFRTQSAIVDGLRFGNLAIRPGANLLRGRQADA